jgi:hypothetical protein
MDLAAAGCSRPEALGAAEVNLVAVVGQTSGKY